MPLPFEYVFTNFIPHFSDVLLCRRIRQIRNFLPALEEQVSSDIDSVSVG